MSDSREQLEADIKKYRWEHGETSGRVTEWLNRQAAITERHWIEICGANANANVELKRQIDSLTAERDELRDECDRLREKLRETLHTEHDKERKNQ